MKARVRGFRGCEKADIEINPIVLLSGTNGAGKSSALQAVAAAATGQAIPFFDSARPDRPRFTKTDAKALLRAGMDQGLAVIEVDGEAASTVQWPALSVSGNGALHCSLVAAGLVVPMDMVEQDRQKWFSGLLQADPTMDDLVDSLKEAIPALADPEYAEALGKVTTMVTTNGWDVAHKHFKEQGARKKGAWEQASGESFGAKKAVNWLPQGWNKGLEDRSLEDLGTMCTDAQAEVEKAVAAVATDAANLKQLEEQAAGEASAWNALQEAKTTLDAAIEDHRAKVAQAKAIVVPTALPCPHCGGLVDVIEGKHLTLRQSVSKKADIDEAKEALKAATLLADKASKRLEAVQTVYNGAKGAHEARKGATERLAEEKKRTGTTEAVDIARDYLTGVLRDKGMVERRDACEVLAAQIQGNQKLVDILAPDGLRRQKLQKALAKFNKALGALSSDAGFATVTIDDELEVLYGGRRYFLLSGSEQYRVRAIIQIATAVADKSPLVILDGADILDQDGRNGLFAVMGECDALRFIVGMTVLSKKNVPDLAKAGVGTSYWIADGSAVPL